VATSRYRRPLRGLDLWFPHSLDAPVTLSELVVPLAGLLVLLIPGLVVCLVAGLRLGTSLAVAPLVTYGMTTATATLADHVDFPWEPPTLVVATVLTGLLVAGLRLVVGRGLPWRDRLRIERPERPGRRDLLVAGGVLGGGVLSAGVFASGFGRLGAVNQDWDYVFHASAVRMIADSGDIAPQAMGRINDWEAASYYYPNTFHAVAAVVRDLTGATVFETLNSQAMIVCMVAGLGLAGLLHRFGAPLAVTALTPVLLAGFASFPYDVLWRGPLLPYAAGVAVIPALILLLDLTLEQRRPAVTLLFGLGTAGLLGVHPSTALSGALFVGVYLLVRWVRSFRTLPKDVVVLAGGGVAGLVLAAPGVLGAVSTNSQGAVVDWPAVMSTGQAVGDLVLLNHAAAAPQYWLAAPLIVGLLTLSRARYMWAWLGGAAVTLALFVMAASSDGPLVASLTRPWWNDRWRFAALVVLGLAPLAAHGLFTVAEGVQKALHRLLESRGRRLPARRLTWALVAAGLLVVVTMSGGLYAGRNSERVAANYRPGPMLNATEIAAMHWLERHSDGGTIMNDANDGSAYLSAEAGLDPLFEHIVEPRLVPRFGPTQQLLLKHFNCLDSDPDVRAAIEDLDIRYVFLGTGFIRPEFTRLPGLTGVGRSPSLELIHEVRGVEIYEVDVSGAPTEPVPACDRTGATG
jgi:hypothetical protein